MAAASKKPNKRRVQGGGRVTPKGGGAKPSPGRSPGSGDADARSGRYTAPSGDPRAQPSPPWVPVLMFGSFLIGVLTIFLNYVEVLPGAVNNAYLLVGLGLILLGIITATQYR